MLNVLSPMDKSFLRSEICCTNGSTTEDYCTCKYRKIYYIYFYVTAKFPMKVLYLFHHRNKSNESNPFLQFVFTLRTPSDMSSGKKLNFLYVKKHFCQMIYDDYIIT